MSIYNFEGKKIKAKTKVKRQTKQGFLMKVERQSPLPSIQPTNSWHLPPRGGTLRRCLPGIPTPLQKPMANILKHG